MKNNYNKLIAFVLLALISVSSQALLYKNQYFVWTNDNVTENSAGMGELAIPGLKSLSRADTAQFWNSGEPNNSSSREHCATQSKNGGWNDTRCDASRRLACFNGTDWAVSPTNVDMNNYWSTQLPPGCPAGYSFAAPMNLDQKLALDAVIPSGEVWINAYDNDRGVNPPAAANAKEGVWVFNRGSTSLFGFDWSGGAPEVNGTKNCASIDPNGKWTAENCSQPRAVVCARQDFSAFQVVNANTANTMDVSTEEMHEICRTQVSEPGQQWMFAAPRSLAENTAVVAALAAANTTGPAWINAIGNRTGETWQTNLDLTNWAVGEPNFSNGQCAVARASDGKWQMADCDSRARLLCTNNGEWVIRSAMHQFSNQAIEACSRPDSPTETNNTYSQHQLVTPITEADRVQAYNALRTGSGVYWLNLKYLADIGTWLRNDKYKKPEFNGSSPQKDVWYHTLDDGSNVEQYGGYLHDYDNNGAAISVQEGIERNKGVTVYFDNKEPNGSERATRTSCIQQYTGGSNAGLWDDTSCTNSKRVACFDGYEWAISPGATALGVDVDANENVSAGHAACAAVKKENGVAGNFVFAAPRSFSQSQQLLTVARESGAGNIWINMNSKKHKRTFVFNLGAQVIAPFWNTGEPNNFNGNEDCAVQRNNGLWNDISCTSTYPVACYSPSEGVNGTWQLTAATYPYSDTTTLTTLCETEFGAQYKFYAPETLSQMNDLKAVMGSNPNAYINANDIEYEGTWVMNQGINNWAVGQQPYANDNKSCVSANASDGQWRTQNCANELPVACSSGGSWYFTDSKVKLDDFANGQIACTAEFGQGYIFQAPRSLGGAEELKYAASLKGVGGDFWINGNSLETHTAWKWNQISLDTPIWGAGQPSGGNKSNCALLNNNSQGAWQDARCDQAQNYAYMCRNGSQWQVSTITGNLADFSTATTACNALGAGWQFAAPATYNENVQAKNAMGGNSQVWVNATDSMKEGVWILNAAPAASYPNWADALQPGNCAYQSDQGKLHTINCASSEENAWSCTDGYTWRVTTAQGKVGKFSDGHKACLNEFGPAFIFAAPLSKDDAIQLDFARLLTATENSTSIKKVWLNMTTGGNAQLQAPAPNNGKFRRNLPFSNWSGKLAGQEPSFDSCAYKGSTLAGVNNPWEINSCTAFSAHYACTNGSQWKVATSKGEIENGVIRIVPTKKDYWSYERGNSMCKEQFGGSYYFSAPVTAAEELALDASIRSTNAQIKRVWLNTYGVSSLSGVDNKWFVNRLHLGVWQKPEFRNYNNSDCAILHPDGSWTDVSCKAPPQDYAFACFNGEWSVKGSGKWEEGFAVCDDSTAAMFAVPRTPDEMAELQSKMSSEPVWINLTDTAFESQWIANRLRFTWWANNEPSNVGNRDCARIAANSGEWYAGKCSIEAAPYACRTIEGGSIKWDVTTSEGIWSDGFGACQREFAGSLFMAPEGYGAVSAKADQDALNSVINTASKDAWINLSDQDVEGSWRAHRAYADWGTESLLDESKNCGYLDRNSKSAGTWLADSCKYTASTSQTRGYACTDGYQWKIVNETATTDMRWSAGFAACQGLGANWRFGAPTNAFENTKLKLVMELHSTEQTQIWLNAHDRFVEGEWQLNGPETNFAPTIDVSGTALKVAENSASIELIAQLYDDEEEGIASANWTLVSNIGSRSGTTFNDIQVTSNQLTAGANGSGTVTAQYSTPVLFKEDRLLTFKVTATDIAPSTASPATAETFVQVRVLGPLVAAWDFNNLSRTNLDITGHGHDAIASTMPQVVVQDGGGVLKLDATSQMVVPGKATDPENGLEYPADNYTIGFRMSIEEPADSTSPFRNILQKGEAAGVRQPLISLMNASDKLHTSHSTSTSTSNLNADTATDVNTLQWINVIYVLNGTDVKLYVDGVEVAANSFNSLLPQQNNGDLYIGMGPAPSNPSFVGFIDDIQVYNRALSPAELGQILPALPLGSAHFAEVSGEVDEDAGTYSITLERTRGDNAELTVYVDFDPANSTATMGVPADMADPTNAADFAFTNESQRVLGKGIPVTWAAGEKGPKSFSITLNSADDGIREGTETARFIISDLNGAKAGTNKYFNLRLLDVTPNPYGNFSVTIDGVASKQVPENSGVQQICFVRESGSQGEVTVNYQVSGNAVLEQDFTYSGGVIPLGSNNQVTFADVESTDKCIMIQPIVDLAIGEPDKNYIVEVTSVNPTDSSHEPLLTLQNKASLTIYDWSPGSFAFTASTYSCKEPNDSPNIPSAIRPSEEELECVVAVQRTNTGRNAPAATLNVTAVNSNGSGIQYSFNNTLSWAAIDAENPINPLEEFQFIEFNIVNNNSQDEDAVVELTLQPTAGEVITAGTAVLNIEDITEPAVVRITRDKATINEGEDVVYTVTRTGNSATYFNFDYNVVLAPEMPQAFTHYFNTSGSYGKEGGILSFTKGGADTHALTFRSIDTTENNADFNMEVILENPNNNFIVGFGDLKQVGTAGNKTSEKTLVKNTRDPWVNALGTILVQRNDGQPVVEVSKYSAAQTTIVEHRTKSSRQVAQNGYIDISIPINPYLTSYDIEDSFLNYEITFDTDGLGSSVINGMDLTTLIRNENGSSIGATGQLVLNPIGKTHHLRVLMPYVTAQTGDIRMDINLTGEMGLNYPIDSYKFKVAPVWQAIAITDSSNECLYISGDNVYWQWGAYGGSNCGSSSTAKFDLNMYTEQLRLQGTNRCMYAVDNGTNRQEVFMGNCNESDNNQKWYWTDGTTIYNRGNSPKLCGRGSGYLALESGSCYDGAAWR